MVLSSIRSILGILIWAGLVFGALPGYMHADLSYANFPDPGAFRMRLIELTRVLAAAIPLTILLGPLVRRVKRPVDRGRVIRWTVALTVATVFGLLSICAFELWKSVPRIPDSIVYLFQAKIFAAGKLWAPVPSPLAPFDYMFTLADQGRWISRYSPGFPVLLALGYWLGMPWIIAPLFGAASVFMAFRLTRKLYASDSLALLTMLLLATSPFFLGISAQVLNHSPCLFLFLLLIDRTHALTGRPSTRNALLIGIIPGLMFLIRQLTAVTLALPFVGFACVHLIRRKQFRALTLLAAGGAVILSIQLLYNEVFTGNPFVFPFHVGSFGELDRLGFGRQVKWDVWPEPGRHFPYHTPWRALLNTHLNLSRMNTTLFGWPSGFFLLALPFLLPVRASRRWDILFLLSVLGTIAGYALYWFPGAGLLGARYYYESMIGYVVLTARGACVLHDALRESRWRRWQAFPAAFIIASSIHAGVMFWPDYIRLNREAFTKAYQGIFEHLPEPPALVFISGDTTSFSFGFFKNDIALKNPILYARDMGPNKNTLLIRRFPERSPYLVQADLSHSRMVPLDEKGMMQADALEAYRRDTEGFDPFNRFDSARWRVTGRQRDCITHRRGQVRVEGEMERDVLPGSAADLRYLDLPLTDFTVTAAFTAPLLPGASMTLSLENGRYLDDFLDLAAVMISYSGPSHEQPASYVFSWKELGVEWHHQAMAAFGDENAGVHRMALTVRARSGDVAGVVDGRVVGSATIPFRSSIVKPRLGVFHDGRENREVVAVWDSFEVRYPDTGLKALPLIGLQDFTGEIR